MSASSRGASSCASSRMMQSYCRGRDGASPARSARIRSSSKRTAKSSTSTVPASAVGVPPSSVRRSTVFRRALSTCFSDSSLVGLNWTRVCSSSSATAAFVGGCADAAAIFSRSTLSPKRCWRSARPDHASVSMGVASMSSSMTPIGRIASSRNATRSAGSRLMPMMPAVASPLVRRGTSGNTRRACRAAHLS